MKKLIKIFSVIMLFIMAFSAFPTFQAKAADDFMTYTENDPNGTLTVNSGNITTIGGFRNDVQNQRVYKADTLLTTDDFEYRFIWDITGVFVGAGSAEWYVALSSDNASAMTNNQYSLGFRTQALAGQAFTTFQEIDNYVVTPAASYGMTLGSVFYGSIKRIGGYGYGYLYSDSAYTNIVYSGNITLASNAAYNYLYAVCAGWSASGASYLNGYIKDMNQYSLNASVGPSSVTTLGVNSWEITSSSAILNAEWLANTANASILGFQYGTTTGIYTTNLTAVGNYTSIPYNLTASNLTGNLQYFYRAEAYDGVTWYYGNELTFTTRSAVSVDTLGTSNVNSTHADLSGVVQALNGNANYTNRGILTSTDNITWSGGKSEIGSWTGITVYLNPSGIFTEQVTFLTANTTYYYKAFAGNSVTGLAFGDVKTFTTLTTSQQTNVPIVQATGLALAGQDSVTGLQSYIFSGNVIQSDTDILRKGIQFSVVNSSVSSITLLGGIQYQYGTWNGSYDNSLYTITSGLGAYSVTSGFSVLQGAQIYWRAYAQNSAGLGFSANRTATTTDTSGFVPIALQSVVAGNSATLYGGWSGYLNPTTGREYFFSWGLTTAGDTSTVAVSGANFQHTLGGLQTNTLYYWRAGIRVAGNTFWSKVAQFTTQSSVVAITGAVNLTTDLAANATATSFVGAMTISAVNSGNATQIGFYMSYNQDGSGGFRLPLANSGNYGVNSYSFLITGLKANALVYYAAFAVNPAGEITGQYRPVQLSALGSANPNVQAVVTTPISNWVLKIARAQGLDNTMGHWAFALETMLAILLFFGIIMIALVAQHTDGSVIKIIAWILLVAEVVDVLAFVFTLWLGIWPLIIGASIVLIVIFILIALAHKAGG